MKTIIVIGGGPAGMAASYAAKSAGTPNVILIERYGYLGGVLPQCIHNGFGTQIYENDYTGGEYAGIWKSIVETNGIDIKLNTTVMSVEKIDVSNGNKKSDKKIWNVHVVSSDQGPEILSADAVIISTGCREKTLPQLGVVGSRPAGIFTAGAVQAMMNLNNYLPGKTAVILGSGDIGLIMARRMSLEGIKVKLILGEKSTGLPRNIVQCVEDFEIPMKYGWTVVSTHGYQRLKGVTIAPFKEDGSIDLTQKKYEPCDTLLVAAGLIPETEICNEYIQKIQNHSSEEDRLFICGNAKFVHDLVDNVTEEAIETGIDAARSVIGPITLNNELNKIRSKKVSDTYTKKEGNMICTVCPKGCMMQVTLNPFSVTGNECERGFGFAEQEIKSPKRIVTTIVKVENAKHPVLSVKTDGLVDKDNIFKVIDASKKIKCKSPINIGDIIATDIAGLDVNLIATNEV